MAGTARTIKAEKFDAEKWSPYGWVPVPDTDTRDGESTLFFEWGDAHLNLIGHDADEVPHSDASLTCEMLFRHRTHTLNVQGRRYAQDNDCCRLDAVGASIQVLADRSAGH